MKTNIFVATLALAATLAACDGITALDLAPESSITDANFWRTADQYAAFRLGTNSYFRTRSGNFFYFGEARAAHFGGVSYGGEAPQGYEVIYNNSLSETSFGISNYGLLYTPINQLNLLIAKTEAADVLAPETRSQYLGEAYGMRAFLYFQLLRTYGAVVVYTDYTSGATLDMTALARPQDAETAVMAQIKSDVLASEAAFQNGDAADKNFWNAAATQLLKAETMLWSGRQMGGGQADYQAAKQAAERAMQLADGARLLTDYASVFAYDNKRNAEIIYAVPNADKETNFREDHWRMNFMPQQLYNNNGSYYLEDGTCIKDSEDATINGTIRLPLDTALYHQLYRDGDTRKPANLRGVFTKDAGGRLRYRACYPRKFLGTMLPNTSTRSFIDDDPIYRYADALLILAEAKALLGESPADELNAVRRRAYGPAFCDAVAYPNDRGSFYDGNKFVASDDDPVEAVLKERLRESIFEGKRWYDLRLFGLCTKYSSASEANLLWPIDQNTLTNNPGLVQTPGYVTR